MSDQKCNKLEESKGRRMGEGLCSSGPYTQATRGQEQVGPGTESKSGSGRNRPDHIQRRSGEVKGTLVDWDELHCVCLNARSLINKFDVFQSWITAIKPDIIGVTETWANKNISEAELTIAGYNFFCRDRPSDREGGGVILYVSSKLQAVEYVPQSNFPKQIWCQILDRNHDKLFIGVCYRTPTDSIFDTDTHSALRELLSEFGSSGRHFLLMGDFNYPLSRWPPQLDSDGLSGQAKEFCHCLEDKFLVQHVTTPTRNENILDLVITDEPDMVTDIIDLGALATSDHHALHWKLLFSTVSCEFLQCFDAVGWAAGRASGL